MLLFSCKASPTSLDKKSSKSACLIFVCNKELIFIFLFSEFDTNLGLTNLFSVFLISSSSCEDIPDANKETLILPSSIFSIVLPTIRFTSSLHCFLICAAISSISYNLTSSPPEIFIITPLALAIEVSSNKGFEIANSAAFMLYLLLLLLQYPS